MASAVVDKLPVGRFQAPVLVQDEGIGAGGGHLPDDCRGRIALEVIKVVEHAQRRAADAPRESAAGSSPMCCATGRRGQDCRTGTSGSSTPTLASRPRQSIVVRVFVWAPANEFHDSTKTSMCLSRRPSAPMSNETNGAMASSKTRPARRGRFRSKDPMSWMALAVIAAGQGPVRPAYILVTGHLHGWGQREGVDGLGAHRFGDEEGFDECHAVGEELVFEGRAETFDPFAAFLAPGDVLEDDAHGVTVAHDERSQSFEGWADALGPGQLRGTAAAQLPPPVAPRLRTRWRSEIPPFQDGRRM